MALRSIPINRAGTRASLVLGGDRELVLLTGGASASLVFASASLLAAAYGIGLWLVAIAVLRRMAKYDPYLRHIYLRHRRYAPYYPVRSTPFRRDTVPRKGF